MSNSAGGDPQTVPNPDDYSSTVSKEEADYIASWAEHFEVGDTIQWTHKDVDGVQESTIVGFSTMETLALPVIEAPRDALDVADNIETFTVSEKVWVPDGRDSIAQIEMEYTQRMTVKIPVDGMPPTERDAFDLVKNTDPEFIADVLPNRWDDAVSVGEMDVVDVTEEEVR